MSGLWRKTINLKFTIRKEDLRRIIGGFIFLKTTEDAPAVSMVIEIY